MDLSKTNFYFGFHEKSLVLNYLSWLVFHLFLIFEDDLLLRVIRISVTEK